MMGRTWVLGAAGLALVGLADLAGAQVVSTPASPPAMAATGVATGATTGAPSAEQPVAQVNGQFITLGELESACKVGGSSAGPVPEPLRRQHQIEVLGLLIDNLLMRQYLDRYAPQVSAEEVDRRLKEMDAGLHKQGKSLEEFCHDTNQTMAQLRAEVADHLRWLKLVAPKLTDAAVKVYYDGNKEVFDKVKVRASHIALRVPAGASEQEKARARARLLEWRQQLQAGKVQVEEIVKANAQDPCPPFGGDLGPFPRKWALDENLAKTAFSLQVGEVSDVVETDCGLHVLKVTERTPGEPSEFARIKEAVREFCMRDMRQQVLGHLRKTSDIKPFNLP